MMKVLITREDAIKAMQRLEAEDRMTYGRSGSEIFDGERAINAIKQIPETESNTEEAFRLFVNWADECGFGYDNIHDLYQEYRDDIRTKGLTYIDGLIYIAKMEAAREAYEREERSDA